MIIVKFNQSMINNIQSDEVVSLREIVTVIHENNRSRDILTITLLSCLIGAIGAIIYLCSEVVSLKNKL